MHIASPLVFLGDYGAATPVSKAVYVKEKQIISVEVLLSRKNEVLTCRALAKGKCRRTRPS
jgi:hypothetical protein